MKKRGGRGRGHIGAYDQKNYYLRIYLYLLYFLKISLDGFTFLLFTMLVGRLRLAFE